MNLIRGHAAVAVNQHADRFADRRNRRTRDRAANRRDAITRSADHQ